jgi:hypothetical protein
LLWALVFYAIITTGCAVAPSIWALITLRFVQGIAVAGAMALARAMVRDISSGIRAGQELSLMRHEIGAPAEPDLQAAADHRRNDRRKPGDRSRCCCSGA